MLSRAMPEPNRGSHGVLMLAAFIWRVRERPRNEDRSSRSNLDDAIARRLGRLLVSRGAQAAWNCHQPHYVQTVSDGVVVGEDGRYRCPWGASTAEYRAYHDDEWGRPVADELRIYEKLCLEGFQAGLSWITILRKRPAFRRAFAEFDPERVAAFGSSEVEALLRDAGIVRHRGKIEAVITNARAVLALHSHGLSLAGLIWSHRPATEKVPAAVGDLEASTGESKALSRELRKNGFAFVGPTTVYSAMQSLGVVNDHLAGCAWREACEADRRRFSVPPMSRAAAR